jgi:hypothetical protein
MGADVLDFASGGGLSVQAVRVHYERGGFTRETHRHPASLIAFFVLHDGKRATPSMTVAERRPVSMRASGSGRRAVLGSSRSRRPADHAPGRARQLVRMHAAAIAHGELQWPVDRAAARLLARRR